MPKKATELSKSVHASLRSAAKPVAPSPATRTPPKRTKPTQAELAKLAPIPEVLRPHLDILFVGINPGVVSGRKQLHFGNPQNFFWKGLYQSSLIPQNIAPEDGHKLWTNWNMSIVNLVQRTTPSTSDLSRLEMRDAVPDLCQKISEYKPKVVCFVGIGIYEIFAALTKPTPGLQPMVYDLSTSDGRQPPLRSLAPNETLNSNEQPQFAHLFVMPSTSGRTTTYQNPEKLMYFRQLKHIRDCVTASPPRPIDYSTLADLGPPTLSKYFSQQKK
ncbi:uracil DNA N-glycosylase Thp1 [Coemansia aciculifera]|uniref:Uracil DNA N-glycosylase Thp1 n=1 Tax=Coemansia aciculifera TaxID=417176 RepID=A0A9W8IH62_9FUNG|nr:uracil DNA N-glycosylase Thp1 [Coemansia aciculifera]KAJ2873143.1 uracil DNA N-glycosylase Thp1 [Coemansia aciculifera]